MSHPSFDQEFGGYRLGFVHGQASPVEQEEAVAFWLAQGAIASREIARQRAGELVYLARRDGVLAGMSTAARKTLGDGRTFFLYRMFLAPAHRVPYLMRTMTNATRDALNATEGKTAAGMLIETENPKLMRPGVRAYFKRHGYLYRGKTPRGLDLWLAPFE